jgi:hypothetical protein
MTALMRWSECAGKGARQGDMHNDEHNVGRYRKQAADCLARARATADPKIKLALLDLAQVWVVLAEEAERYGGGRVDPLSRRTSLRPGNSPPT